MRGIDTTIPGSKVLGIDIENINQVSPPLVSMSIVILYLSLLVSDDIDLGSIPYCG